MGDDLANNMPQRISVGVILSGYERPRVISAAAVDGDFLADVGGSDKGGPAWIPTHGKVIELESVSFRSLPDAHTEVAGGREEFMISVPSACQFT